MLHTEPIEASAKQPTPIDQHIAKTRELVRLLVQTRTLGVTSQANLAERLGWSARNLSNFMTGKSQHKGKMLDSTALDSRAVGLLGDLQRCGFRTDAAQLQLGQVRAMSGEALALQPEQPAPGAHTTPGPLPAPESPPPPPPPLTSAPISTVKLSEIVGAHAGGTVEILSLGERVAGDRRWEMASPRTEGHQTLALRCGFCGCRTVTRGALAGRC